MLSAFALLGIGTACVVWVLVTEQPARRQLARRIDLVTPWRETPVRRRFRIDRVGEVLRRWLTVGAAHRWGMRFGAPMLLGIAAASGAVTMLLLQAVLGLSPWFAAPGAVMAAVMGPRTMLLRQQSRAEAAFLNQFPDAIDMAIRMLRAGLPMTTIMRVLGLEAPAPINHVFSRLADQLDIGMPFGDALSAMGKRVGLSDIRFFAMAVALQSDTGGNLAATLETLSGIIRKRREVRLKARSGTAEVRASGWILGGTPFLVIGLLVLTNPGYLTPLIEDGRGNVIALAAAAMLVLGLGSMRRMMRRVTRL